MGVMRKHYPNLMEPISRAESSDISSPDREADVKLEAGRQAHNLQDTRVPRVNTPAPASNAHNNSGA
jgi:hypothetical protein